MVMVAVHLSSPRHPVMCSSDEDHPVPVNSDASSSGVHVGAQTRCRRPSHSGHARRGWPQARRDRRPRRPMSEGPQVSVAPLRPAAVTRSPGAPPLPDALLPGPIDRAAKRALDAGASAVAAALSDARPPTVVQAPLRSLLLQRTCGLGRAVVQAHLRSPLLSRVGPQRDGTRLLETIPPGPSRRVTVPCSFVPDGTRFSPV